MKQIIIKISPDGTINAETINMKGHECQKYIQSIQELVGAVSVDSKYKDSFYLKVDSDLNSEGANESEEAVSNSVKL